MQISTRALVYHLGYFLGRCAVGYVFSLQIAQTPILQVADVIDQQFVENPISMERLYFIARGLQRSITCIAIAAATSGIMRHSSPLKHHRVILGYRSFHDLLILLVPILIGWIRLQEPWDGRWAGAIKEQRSSGAVCKGADPSPIDSAARAPRHLLQSVSVTSEQPVHAVQP